MDIFRESLDGHGGCTDDDHDADPFDSGDGPDGGDGNGSGGDDGDGDGDGGGGDGGTGGGGATCKVKPAQPLVLATTTLQDLIGLTHGPGELLTTLTGGRIRITNAALRRLVDEGFRERASQPSGRRARSATRRLKRPDNRQEPGARPPNP
ncbi:MAG: hypothetical protein KY469_05875 [Actinobacteria bacterium]|nr:hypothetical protein [Actinomycetota bacterium]